MSSSVRLCARNFGEIVIFANLYEEVNEFYPSINFSVSYRFLRLLNHLKTSSKYDSFPQIVSILCTFVLGFHSLNEIWYSLEGNEQNKTKVQCSYELINRHWPWLPKYEITETAAIKIMHQTVLAQHYQSLKGTVFHVARCRCSKQAPPYLDVMAQSSLENKVLTSMTESTQ